MRDFEYNHQRYMYDAGIMCITDVKKLNTILRKYSSIIQIFLLPETKKR